MSGLSRLKPGAIVWWWWQPEEVGAASHQMGERLTNSEHNNTKVSQEMFDSIIREVVEEIGVPVTSLVSYTF